MYLARPLIYYIYTRKYYHINFKAAPNFKALNQRWDSFIYQIVSMVLLNIDIILITIFFSFSTVSVYTIYAFVFSVIAKIMDVFINGLTSGFGNKKNCSFA